MNSRKPVTNKTNRSATRARRMPLLSALGVVLATAFSTPALAENIVLKASHQFPGGKGDVRDEMVQMIAKDVAAANVGLEIKVFPGSSLVKAQEQWKAMLSGQIDMSAFPLDYASGFHPQFGATLMPGLVKGHAHARRINNSPFMKDIKDIIEQGGVKVLADAWLAGAFGGKDKCIRKPDDVAGMKIRSAGATFAQMWAGAGASIVSIPSSEVYSALQQGVAQGTDTFDRQLRLLPPLRADQVHHRAGRQRAVVHVRAGADLEEGLGPPQRRAEEGADDGVAEGRGLLRQRIEEAR